MEEFIQDCGYIASFVGAFLEGEFSYMTSVFAAKFGYLKLSWVVFFVFCGAYLRDVITFILVDRKGKKYIESKPKLKTKLDRANRWMEKYPLLILCTYRMMFGFVSIIIILAGISNISLKKFMLLSAISNGIWVLLFGMLAYHCSELLTQNMLWVNDHKLYVIGILALSALTYWFFVKRKRAVSILS